MHPTPASASRDTWANHEQFERTNFGKPRFAGPVDSTPRGFLYIGEKGSFMRTIPTTPQSVSAELAYCRTLSKEKLTARIKQVQRGM